VFPARAAFRVVTVPHGRAIGQALQHLPGLWHSNVLQHLNGAAQPQPLASDWSAAPV
jgi:hypothetical protein